MIKDIVERFMQAKPELEERLKERHPFGYVDLVRLVVQAINPGRQSGLPDPDRIVEIDDGHYQGIVVFVIGETGYQPSTYWYVRVEYGSCSACDTLQGIQGYDDSPPTNEQVSQYMTLALHIVQRMKVME